MRNLASSLESRREGDNTIPTSRDAAFDAKMNNNFAEMIAALKKRKETGASSSSTNPTDTVEQKVGGDNEQAKVVDLDTAIQDMSTSKVATVDEHSSNSAEAIEDRVSSASYPVGAKMAVKQVGEHYVEPLKSVHNVMPPTYPQQQPMVCSSALANSKLLAGTPKLAVRQSTNGENTFATGHETPMLVHPTPTPKYRYTTKPTSAYRISSLGPWVCPACTFNNVRNTAKKARCEMCNSVRPVELGSGKWSAGEVVNIDC